MYIILYRYRIYYNRKIKIKSVYRMLTRRRLPTMNIIKYNNMTYPNR